MAVYTSTLPDDLFESLKQKANELALPRNKLIEKAVSIYLDQLNRAAYVKSFKKMNKDADVLKIAEEGMEDYLSQLENI
jgi:uncharacterized protein (DUF924 family)